MEFLKISNVVKKYGNVTVIDGVSFSAQQGEFVVFVGPSGCGKSTLLRLVAGLDEVSEGSIHIDGLDVTEVEPAARGVSMVFQSYALYPHMTVRDNMSFGLKMIKTPAEEIYRRVSDAAAILKLEQLMERRPKELSGGQRQRVAIGRAIVRKPKLFLFDEPLSNLDAELRGEMRVEIARLHTELGVTMVYVTHDQVEAMTLADRIVVLRAGKVEQVGSPADLYDRPVNIFVAGFIGSPKMNFLPLTVLAYADSMVRLSHPSIGEISLPMHNSKAPQVGQTVTLGLRPEHLDVATAAAAPGELRLQVKAEYVENLGGTSQYYTQTPDGKQVIALVQGRHTASKGDPLHLTASLSHTYLFDMHGNAL
jgi:multiple sugar transport system ATP-binding protein/lactose/L-arabinose transport system ATP-binding protein